MMRTSASGSGSTPPELDGDYPRRGSVVAETFRLDALIGEGPSGAVYNAWHLHEHRAYAVKVLHPDLGALTAALVRLRHDNQAIERLRHPHLGAAQSLAGHDPPVLQRLLLPSESLRARLELGPLPLGEVARLFFALCGALEAAARVGVVHGDLKPENVLLLPPPGRMGEPVPQIIDFGLCHLRDREGGIGSHPLLGTVGYLAPEQIQGDGAALDGRADVFALGALLFECLTGHAAFDGATPAVTVAKICLGERPRPSALVPGLPPALDELFERACHRQAEERLPSPRALWTALHAAIGGEEEVRAALREAASPSPPSGRLALLSAGEEAGDGAAPGGDFAPGAASTVSLWPREGRRRGPRRPSGAQAIRLFKELEAAGVAPDGRASSTLPGVGRALAPAARRDAGQAGAAEGAPLLLGEALRPSSATSGSRSAGSQRLRRRTAERAALLLDSGGFPAQATPDGAPATALDDEITGRLHSARTVPQPPSSTGTAPWLSTATLHTPSAATAPSPSAATAQLAAEHHDEARPRPPAPPSAGLGALLGRRHPGEEPLPPVLGLVGRAEPKPPAEPPTEAQAEPADAAAPPPEAPEPADAAAPPAPEPLWLRPLPALCGALLLLLVLLLVLLS